jgi:putative hydrolase of the HAD superfamily
LAAPIHAITFDVGGTLIEPWPSVGDIYARVAAAHGLNVPAELLNGRFHSAWQAQQTFNYTRSEWAQLVDDIFTGLTPALPSETFFPELYSTFARRDAWRVFDDVVPTLDQLASRGIKLGIISNWDERLRSLLRDLRLRDYFEEVIVSCEVGFCKPSAVIFEHASGKLSLPPQSILHVGDGHDTDVAGAKAAGFQHLELSRARGRSGPNQIGSLSDLLSMVA